MLSTTSNAREISRESESKEGADYGVLVTSIGSAGASIISALKMASKMPEQILAFRLFQAPSLLFKNLPQTIAADAVKVLRSAGVECEVQHKDETFTPGDADHEVALVIRDVNQMSALLESVMLLLGAPVAQAKQVLCTTPAVLVGKVSASTVEALRRRFAPFGVEVDASNTPRAKFDAFLADGVTATVRAQAIELAQTNGIEVCLGKGGGTEPIFATNLNREDAEKLHSLMARSKYPVIIVNRDFQRFDVRLEKATPSSELTAMLVETAGMPERVVPKVMTRLPVVTHSNVRYSEMQQIIGRLGALGAVASAQLISFQSFSLAIEKVGDLPTSTMILRGIGGLSQENAETALTRTRRADGPFSSTLARWLQVELKHAGTVSKVVSR